MTARTGEDAPGTTRERVVFFMLFWISLVFAAFGMCVALLLLRYEVLDHIRLAVWWVP